MGYTVRMCKDDEPFRLTSRSIQSVACHIEDEHSCNEDQQNQQREDDQNLAK